MPPTPRKRKALSPPEPRRPPPRMEFRSPADGAWYSARVAMQHGALRVMYEEFPEEQDQWYEPWALVAAVSSVVALRARFRTASPPLDDARCRDLCAGAPLCVSCPLDDGELKFYDAVLESVSPVAHETVDGEERCVCRFMVRWTNGPRAMIREEASIDRVCCVQSVPVQDPVLTEFLDGMASCSTASRVTGVVAEAEGDGWNAPPGFHRKYGIRK